MSIYVYIIYGYIGIVCIIVVWPLKMKWSLFSQPETIVPLLIVEAGRIRAFENLDAHHYHLNSHLAVREQENTFYIRAILYSHWLYRSCDCWERIRLKYCSDVESVFGLWAILYSYWLDWSCDNWERIRVQYCSDVESVFLLSNSYIGVYFFFPFLLLSFLSSKCERVRAAKSHF